MPPTPRSLQEPFVKGLSGGLEEFPQSCVPVDLGLWNGIALSAPTTHVKS